MALNASGPISLGGGIVGQSVDLELGRTATSQISFNDAAVRQLTNTANNSMLSLPSNFWGTTGYPSFTSFIQGYYSSSEGRWVAPSIATTLVDSSGNIFLIGSQSPTVWDTWVAKIDKTGNMLWQKSYTRDSLYYEGYANAACLDAAGNLYWISKASDSTSNYVSAVNKIDTNGNVLYSRNITLPASPSGAFKGVGITIDATQTYLYTVFLVQYFDTYVYTSAFCRMSMSDLTIIDQRLFSRWSSNNRGMSASGGIYANGTTLWMGGTSWNGTSSEGILCSITSGPTVSLQTKYAVSGAASQTPFVKGVDGSGNLLVQWNAYDGTSTYSNLITKINPSTGVVEAVTGVSGMGSSGIGAALTPSNNYIYLTSLSYDTYGSAAYGYILKLSIPTLSLSWQRQYSRGTYTGVGTISPGLFIPVASNNVLGIGGSGGYISGGSRYTYGSLYFQFPPNGSLSGNITYSTSSSAPSNATTTIATSSLTMVSPTITNTSYSNLSITNGVFSIYGNSAVTVSDTVWTIERILQQ